MRYRTSCFGLAALVLMLAFWTGCGSSKVASPTDGSKSKSSKPPKSPQSKAPESKTGDKKKSGEQKSSDRGNESDDRKETVTKKQGAPSVIEQINSTDAKKEKVAGDDTQKNSNDAAKSPEKQSSVSAVEIKAVDLKGYEAEIAALRGQVVVVDFWATWCEPCKSAFPETVKLHGLFGDKGLAVVSMAMELKLDHQGKALAFLKSQKATFKNLICKIDFFEASDLFEINEGIPHYKVYDRQGKLRAVFNLKDANMHLEAKIKELLLEDA